MICLRSKNQKISFLILSLFLLMLLLLSTTTPSSKAEKGRFDRFEGGSSSSVLKSSEFHVGVPGNKEEKHGGDQVFGAKKRKVYAGPNPLHNR
ncbi:hypothetical protein Lalb_Chr24g0400421 [Lupinus albus]|uniref:Uncharacterized protein n=1 Tax=Lupinus albus TaxID=3870 RepID=A0A6A4NI78_LUPAL|nr:hypothetical protein Lalb_Chr24g0400421 [Lupinus albus]